MCPQHGAKVLLICTVALWSEPACQGPQQTASGIEISVSPFASAAKVEAAIRQDNSTETNRVSLEWRDSRWSASLDGLDPSASCEIVATATDGSGKTLASSNAAGALLKEGRTSQMLIALQAPGAGNTGGGSSPLVDTLWASAKQVNAGERVALAVSAHDANPSSALNFEWSARCGNFSDESAATTTWLAPSGNDLCDLIVAVRDREGRTTSAGLQVQVGSGKGSGSAAVAIFINSAPNVTAMTATPGPIENGSIVQLVVSASDADGDNLSYQWTSTCPGKFDNPTQAVTGFAPALTTGTTACSFSVAVTDGRGGVGSGTLVLSASKPVIHVAPAMGLAYQSPDAPGAGDLVFFHVEASSLEGQPLTWKWSANVGSFTAETDLAGSSETSWTAPDAKDVSCTITVTATDPEGASAAYIFSVRT
jgi:hypothetical protein